MHTFKANGGTIFNSNGDLSGDVIVRRPDGSTLDIPGDDLISFLADFVRGEQIHALENAEDREILGIAI